MTPGTTDITAIGATTVTTDMAGDTLQEDIIAEAITEDASTTTTGATEAIQSAVTVAP